jgi:Lon protease-like protein
MKAGNKSYNHIDEIPEIIPIFPLSAALLLPGAHMPLNVFEPRYLAMVDDVLLTDRLIGMVQPSFDEGEKEDTAKLCQVGCVGRITAFQETGDGRYLLNLSGISRFRIVDESAPKNGYRRCHVKLFADDLNENQEMLDEVNREELLSTFKAYLDANEMEADWEGVSAASTEMLVNTLAMMSPYGPAEKQALLEAPDLKTRAETLIAITEFALAKASDDSGATLQ